MSGRPIILIAGNLLATAFIWPGLLLRYTRRYHWIAGYNRAPSDEQQNYDIEGLSHHLGNGLFTIGVCLLGATIAIALGSAGWFMGLVGAMIFFCFLIVVGGQKFTPRARFPLPGESGHTTHRFFRWLLPERSYRAMESGTRHWQYEFACGHTKDYWDAGGIRYKALGKPLELRGCERCGKISMQKVRRKPPMADAV
jgi:hypothetical protein